MTWKSSIQAVHNDFATFDNSNVQSNFVNTYLPAPREFQSLRVFDSTNIQSNFLRSSYIYLLSNYQYLAINEGIILNDIVLTEPVPVQETGILFDQVIITAMVNPIFSCKLVINGLVTPVFSSKLQIGQPTTQTFSTGLNIGAFGLAPVTSIP